MSNELRTTIENLASQFVSGVLAAMRKAPLEDILDQTSAGGRRGPAPRAASSAAGAGPARAKRGGKAGRLARRSPTELAKVLDEIVALLQKNPEGLRAEQIRDQLSLLSKELPRPLADGVSSGRLRKKGEKRATTYFATGRAGSAAKKTKK
jgi:hypothetical protein